MIAAEGLEGLRARLEAARSGGGPEKVEKQHKAGKLTAWERLAILFDPDTFIETGTLVRHRCTDFGMADLEAPGDGVVTGHGRVDGRSIMAFAQDFTVVGGSLGQAHAAKIARLMDLALKSGCPVVGLNDSAGARIHEGVDALDGYGQIFFRNTLASGVIPQVAAIMGPCAGGAVYSPALTDFVFMVAGTAQMFITGPQVIKAVTGEEVTLEQLGGAATHSQVSGVAHFYCADDRACLQDIRRLLRYLPANNLEDPPFRPTSDPAGRVEPGLRELVPQEPNRPYDVRDVLRAVIDDGEFLEVHAHWAANLVTGFAALGGRPVGIVANQACELAGCIDIDASDKAARFVRFCDAFNFPIITLVDTPGYLPGTAQEYGGIIRHGAKVLYAYSEATVPKVQLILRKAYGGAYIAMSSRSLGADLALAWPGAEIAVLGPEGAANIIFRDEIAAAPDPAQARRERVEDYRLRFANPYVAAGRGYLDLVIDPAETRPTLIRGLEALASKRETRPARKHGSLPL
ncbi:MAG TPA: methylmalonyl-CoA carboxyltransferase [Clostridiales bacterium]|nr:methylmalonyl-CoA carboxyltransferase [Clostridiales bacterium]